MKNFASAFLLLSATCLSVPASGQWVETYKIFAGDPEAYDAFGLYADVYENIVAVAAPQSDDFGSNTGSVYLFDANTGTQYHKLLPNDAHAIHGFGNGVSLSENWLIVGALADSDGGHFAGAAYVFDNISGAQMAKILSPSPAVNAQYGTHHDAAGNRVICAERRHGNYPLSAAHVYSLPGGGLEHSFVPTTAADWISGVAISESRILLGREDADAPGLGAIGAVDVYDADTKAHLFRLQPNDLVLGADFGRWCAVSDEIIVVFAVHHGFGTRRAYVYSAIDGTPLNLIESSDLDARLSLSGTTFITQRAGEVSIYDAISGTRLHQVWHPDGFGRAIGISDQFAVVGAWQDSDAAFQAGAAYIFEDQTPVDTDGDGLLDDWEMNGIPYTKSDGSEGRYLLDYDNDGTSDADYEQKDLFVEVDMMEGHIFWDESINMLVEAFEDAPVDNPSSADPYAESGIRLWIQVDEDTIPFEEETLFPNSGWPNDVLFYKSQWFGTVDEQLDPDSQAILEAKAKAYRYCITLQQIRKENGKKIGGRAELPGDDFVIVWGGPENLAAKFMHELGHNLNLRHGGGDNWQAKPNYPSVMNYVLTYRETWNRDFWELDYSREELPTLNEANLDEGTAVGAGGSGFYASFIMPYYSTVTNGAPCFPPLLWDQPTVAYASLDPNVPGVDFNLDCDILDTGVAIDLNYLQTTDPPLPGSGSPSPGQSLTGHNDWANIELPVVDGGGDFAAAPALEEITDEQRQVIRDTFTVPPQICEADWNRDSIINTADFVGFLNDWSNGNYRADINVDGILNTSDFVAYLNLWNNGCP